MSCRTPALLLLRTAEKTGLTCALSTALAPWRKPLATHDPGKIVLDLAVTLALGGDCLADIAQLRAHPKVHAFIEHLTKRRLGYSVGFGLTDAMAAAVGRHLRGAKDRG
ncbi:hypothetical protein RHDE110596_20165 [Prescottella defluvii]